MTDQVSPALLSSSPALHSPRLVGDGLSADTSSALLLEFYLWGQGDDLWATETVTRDQTALPSRAWQSREILARLIAGKGEEFILRLDLSL